MDEPATPSGGESGGAPAATGDDAATPGAAEALDASGFDAPSFDASSLEGEEFPLHPRLRRLWLLQAVIATAALSVPLAGGLLLSGRWWLLPLVPVLALVVVLASALYATAWSRRFRCLLLADGLLLRRGVWWRSEVFVPRARVQHTELHEGPLLRQLGMAALRVFTAGTRVAELGVTGLPRESALRLRDRLLDRHGDDAL
jgi:membrane protein YdbS with pleckstrin-like domain